MAAVLAAVNFLSDIVLDRISPPYRGHNIQLREHTTIIGIRHSKK